MSTEDLISELNELSKDKDLCVEEPAVKESVKIQQTQVKKTTERKTHKFDLNNAVDDIVKREQQKVEDRVYDGLYKLIEAFAENRVPVIPVQEQYHTPQPQVQPEKIVSPVMDNPKLVVKTKRTSVSPTVAIALVCLSLVIGIMIWGLLNFK